MAERTQRLEIKRKHTLNLSLSEALELIEEQKATIARLKDLATKDDLSLLHNRRGTFERLEQLIRDRRQVRSDAIAFLMLDIDEFKKVNDTHGHAAGDSILRQAAEFLRSQVRETDILGRVGGEEFLVVYNGRTATEVVENFERKNGRPSLEFRADLSTSSSDISLSITFSGGVTDYVLGEEVQVAIERADQALYQAKQAGRNRILLANK